MGHRGVIAIKVNTNILGDQNWVVLYTHWKGWKLPALLLDVLETDNYGRGFTDIDYLIANIFNDMLGATTSKDREGMSFGINSYPCKETIMQMYGDNDQFIFIHPMPSEHPDKPVFEFIDQTTNTFYTVSNGTQRDLDSMLYLAKDFTETVTKYNQAHNTNW